MVTFKRIVSLLETEHPPNLSTSELMLQNDDLLPVPPKYRLWKWYNFCSFWLSDGFNLNTLMIASGMISSGLNWWQAWLAVWVGYSVAAVFLVLQGRQGAIYHISFPVLCRSTFGIWGSLWPVFNRAAMACIWTGVQSYIGGNCMYVLLIAIWPSYRDVPNGIPNSGTDTAHFVSFFLFCMIQAVAVWFPIHSVRHLFTLKALTAPLAGFLFFGWCIAKANGLGPIIHEPTKLAGSTLGWTWIGALMSCISNMATLVTNNPDITSRADKLSSVVWPQLITLPLVFGITSFLGIIIGSSSTVIYGTTIWDPLEILGRFLDNSPSSAVRCGVAFIAIAFIIAQIGVNISANTISAGQDLTALFPRFINIRRGGYIAAIVGFCMCPWTLLSSSNKFASYLSAYSVFLAAIIGPMLVDFYIVRKGLIALPSLYTKKNSLYYFNAGINWRAYAAYLSGIAINIVGFTSVADVDVPMAAIRIYQLAFFTGILTSGLIYYLLNRFFPAVPVTSFDVVTDGEWSPSQRSSGSFSDDSVTEEKKETEEGVAAYTQAI